MRRLTTQQTLLLGFAGTFVVGGMVIGSGLTVTLTPDPKPVIRTIVRDVPPGCEALAQAAVDERDASASLAAATEGVLMQSAELSTVVLSADPDAITEQGEALDDAKRAEQAAQLDLATTQVAVDTATTDCLGDS